MQVQRTYAVGRVLVILVVILGLMAPSTAEASWLDRVKDIYQMPENIEQIQQDYESTKQQLEDQKDKLAETIRRSEETEEKLLNQNEQLLKENEQLQERLKVMEQAALDKEQRNRKITNMVIVAAMLVVLYFVMGRVFRYVVWRRQKHQMK
jgi:TolA-binding protein